MNRRTLRFPDYDAVLAEAESLLAGGYDRVGQWSLGQVCQHLAIVLERSLDGFPSLLPWPVQKLARWLVLGRLLRREVLRRRYPAPAYLQPPVEADDAAGVARLRAVLGRVKAHTGPMAPSPIFGALTPEEWREVSLWHCEHHLSFLLPRRAN